MLYPNQPGKKFDWDHYLKKHIGGGVEAPNHSVLSSVDKGFGTNQPGAPAPFLCIAHMYFNNMGDFQKVMATMGGALMAT